MLSDSVSNKGNSDRAVTSLYAYITALCICVLLSVFLSVSFFARDKNISDIDISRAINPNTEPLASLLRLPNIGPSLAKAIIEYREKAGGNNIAFEKAEDLQEISGIGPKTVESMKPWLCFQ